MAVSYGQSKVERINPPTVNERTVGRSGGFFVLGGFIGRSGPRDMVKPKQGGLAMPTGLFRTTDQSAQVEYDGVSIPIPRSTYEKNGYKPDFDKLPLEDEYKAAQEKLRNALRP
ncbi:hypothetical protein KIP88_41800 [Bradyrhizobium sp. SRL28]|uniref:hypothetical protein n=1 Tax=Bradyrhizobium sp. SRL28 TaxID=2836178 RepID=UPI001BDF13FF|nr:hypothetical protein [Bradyrhizobium sp. SRL28]MBT1516932.1 hypothetical protein [Bradyrhizobium sp. SRL28]